jgi:hypothetical protein
MPSVRYFHSPGGWGSIGRHKKVALAGGSDELLDRQLLLHCSGSEPLRRCGHQAANGLRIGKVTTILHRHDRCDGHSEGRSVPRREVQRPRAIGAHTLDLLVPAVGNGQYQTCVILQRIGMLVRGSRHCAERYRESQNEAGNTAHVAFPVDWPSRRAEWHSGRPARVKSSRVFPHWEAVCFLPGQRRPVSRSSARWDARPTDSARGAC